MKCVFVVSQSKDFDTAEEAIQYVESSGEEHSVVKFLLEPNLPGRLPEYVHKSVGLWSYQGGEWWSHYIYDGTGAKLERQRPK
jgi:hypothetical protein